MNKDISTAMLAVARANLTPEGVQACLKIIERDFFIEKKPQINASHVSRTDALVALQATIPWYRSFPTFT